MKIIVIRTGHILTPIEPVGPIDDDPVGIGKKIEPNLEKDKLKEEIKRIKEIIIIFII